jgi:hypothetical protein
MIIAPRHHADVSVPLSAVSIVAYQHLCGTFDYLSTAYQGEKRRFSPWMLTVSATVLEGRSQGKISQCIVFIDDMQSLPSRVFLRSPAHRKQSGDCGWRAIELMVLRCHP